MPQIKAIIYLSFHLGIDVNYFDIKLVLKGFDNVVCFLAGLRMWIMPKPLCIYILLVLLPGTGRPLITWHTIRELGLR